MIPVHLKTQRNQPYGSERRCCELCHVRLWIPKDGIYVDDPDDLKMLPDGYVKCSEVQNVDQKI